MSKLEIEFWFSAEYTVGQFNDLVDKIIAIYLCQSQLWPGRFNNISPSTHILTFLVIRWDPITNPEGHFLSLFFLQNLK